MKNMPKLIRHEFMGSWFTFWLPCVTIVFIPVAIVYLITRTVTIEEQMDNPQAFIDAYRNGRV